MNELSGQSDSTRNIQKSLQWKKRAEELIPSCTQTYSKGPSQFIQGVAPVFLQKGKGAHVWDVDGNEYIDYMLGLGPVVLGYGFPEVTRAVVEQAGNGAILSLPHPLEVEVAELLVENIPCAEMVRFGKNGSDATSGAVRLARAYTGREKIACCGYHGWQDWYIAITSRNGGIPSAISPLTIPFQYNDIASLERVFVENHGEIAAVIMEPVSVAEPKDDFLAKVRDIAHANGSLLIFDEIITGFRFALAGAQELYGVIPDLACFGKAMANGYPISAVVGRRELMRLFDEIFYSFTFAGDAIALAAAKATITSYIEKNVIASLYQKGASLKEGVDRRLSEHGLMEWMQCNGLSPRTVLSFTPKRDIDPLIVKSLLQQEMIGGKVLSPGYHNICYSLSEEDISKTLDVYDQALLKVKDALKSGEPGKYLAGPPVEPVFRKI